MVKNLLNNGRNIFFQQQKTIVSGAVVIGLLTLTSAILGLVKMRLYAGVLGAGIEFDIFVAAFKIPDFIYQLVILGSLNAAFIPIFSEYISKQDSATAWGFASSILNLSLLFFASLAGVCALLAPRLAVFLTPGFSPEQILKLTHLMRLMLLSPLLLGVSAFISGAIQSFRRFLIPFLSPVAYNLGGIIGILFFYPVWGISGLAYGVIFGCFLHLLMQLPLLFHLGFRYFPVIEFKNLLVKKMGKLILPRVLGLAAEQIKVIIFTNFASFLATGSISLLRFGESIFNLPLSVVGVAIAQASLPTLSYQSSQENLIRFKRTLLSSLHQILYLILPISVVLIVLKIPVTRLVLGIGKFDWSATVLTSWILALLSLSLFAQASSNLLIRAFYALQDTKTPVVTSVVSVFVSITGALILKGSWQVRGLALAVSLGALLEFFLLLFFLNKKIEFDKKALFLPILKMSFASAVMAIAIYFPVHFLDEVFIDTRKVINLVVLVWLVLSFGGTVYLFLTWFLGCREIRLFLRILLRIRSWRETASSASKIPPPPQSTILDDGFFEE